MSERDDAVAAGTTTTRLSLAVKLVDAFTGGRPAGTPRVSLADVDADPIEKPSGYRVFLDLDAGPVTVDVDGGEPYLDARREDVDAVDLSDPDTDLDPSDPDTLPVTTVELLPAPPYRFPAGATLVRGHV